MNACASECECELAYWVAVHELHANKKYIELNSSIRPFDGHMSNRLLFASQANEKWKIVHYT